MPSSRTLMWLAASALAVFAIGEGIRFARSDAGQLTLARQLGLGSPARLTTIVSGELKDALNRAGVPADSISEHPAVGDGPVVWRVGVRPEASLLQVNYAVTRTLETRGAEVLSGQETWTRGGSPMLRLMVGLPRRATHELQIVRARRGEKSAEPPPTRLALVLYGWGENAAAADSFFALPVPFGVAIAPGNKASHDLFKAAHARSREVVLHLPLEPINYPRINPGPGTLLVTMKPADVAGALQKDLKDAGPVAAVANHMGSLATQDMTLMRAVFHELRREDVPFLHVTPAAGAVCKSLASEMGVTYDEPDEVLDYEARLEGTRVLDQRWQGILKRAKARGDLIVWLRATPLTRRWVTQALAPAHLQGVNLVPLATLIRKPPPI